MNIYYPFLKRFLLVWGLLTPIFVFSQKTYPLPALPKPVAAPTFAKWESGFTTGMSQGQTDLTNFGTLQQNVAGQIFARRHLSEIFALRGNVMFGKLSGSDIDYPTRIERGFSYTTPLTEFSLMLEIDLLGPLRYRQQTKKFRRIASPYVFGGVGIALTAPDVNYNERKNDAIIDLIREDRNNTKNSQTPIPVGFGVKFDIAENWVLGVESGVRLLFNDYLDGVSATGGRKGRDTYSFMGLSLSYRIPRQ